MTHDFKKKEGMINYWCSTCFFMHFIAVQPWLKCVPSFGEALCFVVDFSLITIKNTLLKKQSSCLMSFYLVLNVFVLHTDTEACLEKNTDHGKAHSFYSVHAHSSQSPKSNRWTLVAKEEPS